jgi:hypothetical protein
VNKLKPGECQMSVHGLTVSDDVPNAMNSETVSHCILCQAYTKEGLRYIVYSEGNSSCNKATSLYKSLPNQLKSAFKFDRGNFLCKTCSKILEKREKIAYNLEAEEKKILAFGNAVVCMKRGLTITEDNDAPARKFIGIKTDEGLSPPLYQSTPVRHPILDTTTTACTSSRKSLNFAKQSASSKIQDLGVKVSRNLRNYCQRWNRSVNNHGTPGKNVPLDLDLEHDNNYLKEAMRKMGPASTEQSVTRVCRALKIAREVVENANRECKVMKRSGIHFVTRNEKDLVKVINKLLDEKALTETKGREYKTFTDCQRSHLKCIKMVDFCKWINNHKRGMIIGRTAR